MANAPSQFNLAKGVATLVPQRSGYNKMRMQFSYRIKGKSESSVIAEIKKRNPTYDVIIESVDWIETT